LFVEIPGNVVCGEHFVGVARAASAAGRIVSQAATCFRDSRANIAAAMNGAVVSRIRNVDWACEPGFTDDIFTAPRAAPVVRQMPKAMSSPVCGRVERTWILELAQREFWRDPMNRLVSLTGTLVWDA
jgi:hypothetical protein